MNTVEIRPEAIGYVKTWMQQHGGIRVWQSKTDETWITPIGQLASPNPAAVNSYTVTDEKNVIVLLTKELHSFDSTPVKSIIDELLTKAKTQYNKVWCESNSIVVVEGTAPLSDFEIGQPVLNSNKELN